MRIDSLQTCSGIVLVVFFSLLRVYSSSIVALVAAAIADAICACLLLPMWLTSAPHTHTHSACRQIRSSVAKEGCRRDAAADGFRNCATTATAAAANDEWR